MVDIMKSKIRSINPASLLPIKKFSNNLAMRIVFAGSDKTGTKTSFIGRYMTGSYNESPQKCFTEPEIKKIRVNGAAINVSLIDAPGHEKAFTPYLSNSAAAVVGYDITSVQTLENACRICSSIKAKYPQMMVMLVGGMADKGDKRAISTEEAKKSAKSIGVDLLFEGIHSFISTSPLFNFNFIFSIPKDWFECKRVNGEIDYRGYQKGSWTKDS